MQLAARDPFRAIAGTLAHSARADLAKAAAEAAARPVGSKAIAFRFASAADANKPIASTRYRVRRVRWTGTFWQPYGAPLSGPLPIEDIYSRLAREAIRLGLPRVD